VKAQNELPRNPIRRSSVAFIKHSSPVLKTNVSDTRAASQACSGRLKEVDFTKGVHRQRSRLSSGFRPIIAHYRLTTLILAANLSKQVTNNTVLSFAFGEESILCHR
jgi:hypothetical protein